MKELRMNNGVPPEMAKIYETIFGKVLHETWIYKEFEGLIALTKDEPKDIANTIESSLVADMKLDTNDRKFNKIVRIIILKI